jgi:hypothetical protein
MSGTTISGTHSIGITLDNTYPNPVSVTGTITVASGNALYGLGGPSDGGDGPLYGWTIDNSGTIGSSGALAVALGSDVASTVGDIVTNGTAGVVYGANVGVYIQGSGSVTNLSGGIIGGTAVSAIDIDGGTGTIVNLGTLVGRYGASEGDGGSVTNLGSGTITGSGNAGIRIAGGTGTIVNSGSVLGGRYGTDEVAGGSVTNELGGIINGNLVNGVYTAAGGAGTVVNYGVLIGALFGVKEGLGGSVTNQSSGTITGTGGSGIYISRATGAVVNYGSLVSNLTGVYLKAGGSVSNQLSANITGTLDRGIYITGGPGTIVNAGSVYGGRDGAYLYDGGTITNQATGTISGGTISTNTISGVTAISAEAISGSTGIFIYNAPGTVTNAGSVYGSRFGAYLNDGGTITNRATGTISGGTSISTNTVSGGTGISAEVVSGSTGIVVDNAPGTVTNAGSVYGGLFGAHLYDGGTITNQANGTISGGSGGTGIVLDNASGTVTNAGTISAGAVAIELFGGSTLTNSGTIHAGSAVEYAVQFSSGITNKLIVDPGAVFYGVINGGGGEIDLAGTSPGTLAGFDGTSITNFASLQFDTGADWTISGDSSVDGLSGISSIGGFNVGDTIDLTDFMATSVAFASNQLVLTTDGATDTLNITGGFQTADFSYIGDGESGTDITVTATCYAAGTRIRTTRGEVAVENLREGDLVLTVSGRTQPISWIGHRHVNFHGHPNRQRILPVRITAHAFGQGMPERDLLLSPDHAVFVEDVLIPIRHLVNGGSIAQIECDTITYYHIELPRHDVLLADGMPAESYLEAGARDAFANVDGVIQLHPDFEPPRDHYAMLWEAEAYAPLVVAGEQFDRAREKLARQARLLSPLLSPGPRRLASPQVHTANATA